MILKSGMLQHVTAGMVRSPGTKGEGRFTKC